MKRVKRSFWQDPTSEPKKPTELSDFAAGGQTAGSYSMGAQILDPEGNEIKLEADSDEEPEEPRVQPARKTVEKPAEKPEEKGEGAVEVRGAGGEVVRRGE